MNPQGMFQIMSALNTFRQNHPKVAQFFVKYIKSGLPEGSIIEITVTRPGEEPMTTNMKVQQSDLELVQALKDINPQG